MTSGRTSGWSLEGKSTWLNVAAAVLVFAGAVLNLSIIEKVLWKWVAIGFVMLALFGGLLATSVLGTRIGEWLRAIGLVGQLVVGFVFVAVGLVGGWAISGVLEIPSIPALNFVNGMVLAASAVLASNAVREREIA